MLIILHMGSTPSPGRRSAIFEHRLRDCCFIIYIIQRYYIIVLSVLYFFILVLIVLIVFCRSRVQLCFQSCFGCQTSHCRFYSKNLANLNTQHTSSIFPNKRAPTLIASFFSKLYTFEWHMCTFMYVCVHMTYTCV